MSANSKRARKIRAARDMKGRKGPAKTMPKHTKQKAWYQVGDARIVKQTDGGEVTAFAIRRSPKKS